MREALIYLEIEDSSQKKWTLGRPINLTEDSRELTTLNQERFKKGERLLGVLYNSDVEGRVLNL